MERVLIDRSYNHEYVRDPNQEERVRTSVEDYFLSWCLGCSSKLYTFHIIFYSHYK